MTNYQKQLDEIIGGLGDRRPRVLLHSCCGPCSSYCIEYLAKYFEVTVFYFNPNVHPQQEYEKRLATQKKLVGAMGLATLCVGTYHPQQYFDAVKGHEQDAEGGERCSLCFSLRLQETARQAKLGKYDYFCTTLTVSPHKNAEVINEIGGRIAEQTGIAWLPADFKKREGYKRSIELSRQYELYRQTDCGCIYSK